MPSAQSYPPLRELVVDPLTGLMTRPWSLFNQTVQQFVTQVTESNQLFVGTHADRVARDAAKEKSGNVFFETDRTLFYIIVKAAWIYATGQFRTTFAGSPSDLGSNDAGLLCLLSDYGHLVRWTGTVWEFAPGDVGNAFFRDFVIVPQEAGWQLADGTATTYLTVGAKLVETSFTTPNLTGTAAYRKSAAAYSGTINAASGASGSAGTTISGTTASEAAHTHSTPNHSHTIGAHGHTLSGSSGDTAVSHTHAFTTSANSSAMNPASGGLAAASDGHTHTGTTELPSATTHNHGVGTYAVGTTALTTNVDGGSVTGAGSAHSHGAGTLAADPHTHGVGTLDMPNLGVLVYFRR